MFHRVVWRGGVREFVPFLVLYARTEKNLLWRRVFHIMCFTRTFIVCDIKQGYATTKKK